MKTILLAFILLAMSRIVADDAFAQQKATPKKESSSTSSFVLMSYKDLIWQAFGEEFPGVDFALADGDPSKGAYAMYVRLPAGFKLPLHYHGNDEWGVIISGTVIIGLEDGRKTILGPGSYVFSPKMVRHTTEAGPDGCIFLEVSNEKESTIMVEEARK